MKYYIKGNYRRSIFSSEKGYVIGIFKVRETNDERLKDYVNRSFENGQSVLFMRIF